MRGPVGSLALPEQSEEYEQFSAGDGVTVYVHRGLIATGVRTIDFAFGLLGKCTATID